MVNHNPPTRKPKDWVPPVPAFSAKVSDAVTIAYYGVQIRGVSDDLEGFRAWLATMASGANTPDWADYAEYTDALGHYTWLAILYWRGPRQRYTAWTSREDYTDFWNDSQGLEGDTGYFREVLHIPNDRLETLYSHDVMATGVGGDTGLHEGPIQSHNYWGSMRDRIPLSSSHDLEPPALLTAPGDAGRHRGFGERVTLVGLENLATIRSGEIFGDVTGYERDVFDGEIVPAVREGMLYLRDNPVESGCYLVRHMTETDATGTALPRAFATAHFDSLTRLEDWAESHPTHLRIFGRFIELAQELRGDVKLKLWHEVTVTPGHLQEFEYVNCHPATGMMPYSERLEPATA